MVAIAALTTYRVVEYLSDLSSRVLDSFSSVIEVFAWPDLISPDMHCFDWRRRQYFAPCIIKQLSSITRNYDDAVKGLESEKLYVVGVGYIDGYDKGLNFVFGEASPISRVAVVFTKRLDQSFYGLSHDYNLYVDRVSKEVVHELGHLLGLGHCSDRSCVMSFSNSVHEVDEKSRFFCTKCSSYLSKALSY